MDGWKGQALLNLKDLIREGSFWETAQMEVQIQLFFQDVVIYGECFKIPIHQGHRTLEYTKKSIKKESLELVKPAGIIFPHFQPCRRIIQQKWENAGIPEQESCLNAS